MIKKLDIESRNWLSKLYNESSNTPNSDVVLAVAGTIQRGEGAFARRLMSVRRGVGPGCCADSSDAIQSQRVWDQPGAGAWVRRWLLMSRFVSRDNRGAASAACGRVERSSAAVSESAVGTQRAHRDAAYSA